ncbi:Response regulator receiver domain-containing protein [Desulfoluna spongiiphila]|uniref:Response regulator receiver domain-containing protein n=1 Tax=Desulfoluna spongiiphila TaxID=419481 RepID=A0A1G5JHN5_9BACT|nr:Response regulator receiver domain-containing protein [Desulfoluna spongiiphila]
MEEFDSRFKVFYELMPCKIREILLVSSLYDACIMEEDGRLSEKIVNEYRGLNLSRPPRLTWVSTAEEALDMLEKRSFDMVVTMLRLVDMDAFTLGEEIKRKCPSIPVVLLTHSPLPSQFDPVRSKSRGVDRMYVWTGNADILLALIKSEEDRLNVAHDTQKAGVRLILMVEDSPLYTSAILPILYKEVVTQVQNVMEEVLNHEHRLLTMRARPKILVTQSYEEAMEIYEEYKEYILGVISDASFPREGVVCDDSGYRVLSHIQGQQADIPLMMASTESSNRSVADVLGIYFVDKNSPSLSGDFHHYFVNKLGFGDFVFRDNDGRELGRAPNFRALEKMLADISDECFYHHWKKNDFSRWFFARSETLLANRLRPATDEDFRGNIADMKAFILKNIQERRRNRQKGVVVQFDADEFDPETEFLKIGNGSLGGKARGLVFASTLLRHHPELHETFGEVEITLPQTLVISTEGFDAFMRENDLKWVAKADLADDEVIELFQNATFPGWIDEELRAFLKEIRHPLAVRSSALFEDAQFMAYAGLYHTCMISNDNAELEVRLNQLISAVKLVYASTYFQGPKSFARRVGHRTEEEKMAVIIQQVSGRRWGEYYYPAVSGVAQSYNYYPFGKMEADEGIAAIAMGLGRTVVEGEQALRFSPRRPHILPQFSRVEEILKNAQQSLYALKVGSKARCSVMTLNSEIEKLAIRDLDGSGPVSYLSGTYVREENTIRYGHQHRGPRVLTFDKILKYNMFPLPELLAKVLDIGAQGMGSSVEIEFAVELPLAPGEKGRFVLLQIRPMTDRDELADVVITDEEKGAGVSVSSHALGNVKGQPVTHILYVKPDTFDLKHTREIAREIGRMNVEMARRQEKYLLLGPGRWGSADRWLGIPVTWEEISEVCGIIESSHADLKADPSQGSHFFHNITALGINYVSILEERGDYFDMEWLLKQPVAVDGEYTALASFENPCVMKVDGRHAVSVLLPPE